MITLLMMMIMMTDHWPHWRGRDVLPEPRPLPDDLLPLLPELLALGLLMFPQPLQVKEEGAAVDAGPGPRPPGIEVS